MANKTISDLQLRSAVVDSCQFPTEDGVQTYRVTGPQILDYVNASFNSLDAAGADAATTLTISDERIQVVTPTADRIYKLPTTSVKKGMHWKIFNTATANYKITVQSSGSNEIGFVPPSSDRTFIAVQDTPTTAAHWLISDRNNPPYAGVASGTYTSASGYIGETVIQTRLRSATTAPGASGTTINCTANPIALTAGIWLIGGIVGIRPNGMTALTLMTAGINTTSATIPASDDTTSLVDLSTPTAVLKVNRPSASYTPGADLYMNIGPYPAYITGSANYYMCWVGTYSTANPYIYGSLWATRIA
jgi:hypothetical protein